MARRPWFGEWRLLGGNKREPARHRSYSIILPHAPRVVEKRWPARAARMQKRLEPALLRCVKGGRVVGGAVCESACEPGLCRPGGRHYACRLGAAHQINRPPRLMRQTPF